MSINYKPIVNLSRGSQESDCRPKRLAVLGATGSIGRQTLDIVSRYPDRYRVSVLTANRSVDRLVEAALRHRPQLVVVADENCLPALRRALTSTGIECAGGAEALAEAVTRDDVDMVVTATVGYSGLLPTLSAISSGKDIALANKETLVVAGDLIRRCLDGSATCVYPVDSEHSAITQCLIATGLDSVARLIITASGGPFRTYDAASLDSVKASDALRHPNWNMGAKITIDSATMMNKAFEIIEAHYLFGLPAEKIDAVVHPQSIVHSMVETVDGAVLAQLGVPDMRIPIAFALGQNSRMADVSPRLTLERMSTLTFEAPDTAKFPCLDFARLCLVRGGNTACIVNAANEIAVDAFLKNRIRFTDFAPLTDDIINDVPFIATPALDDYIATNTEARRRAAEWVNKHEIS